MKKRTIPLLFLFVIVVIAIVFFLSQKVFVKKDKSLTRAKIVTPKSLSVSEGDTEKRSSSIESEKYETFVPLYTGETLISTLTIDINNDGYDDEVIIVRKSNSQNLCLVAAIIDPETGDYHRLSPIETEFTKTRTFSYTGMDITGDHKTALIYQGLADDGNYIMKIYHWGLVDGRDSLVSIGDFACDGTVFVQQTERSESYELGQSRGESFSVWVYKSEVQDSDKATDASKAENRNQIQQEYKWNAGSQKYQLAQEIRVTAGRLAAKELSRIQDGTVETFGAFLNGLWYKTSNDDGEIRYLYFDYDNKEIIQISYDNNVTDESNKNVEEVYEWEDSKLRHNGIYITALNADISTLHRRFDIALVNVDEIKVTLRDDINLIIKENTMWDGQYKKMSIQSSFNETGLDAELETFITELRRGPSWSTSDGLVTLRMDEYTYSLNANEILETGIYSYGKNGAYNILYFRSDFESSVLNENYSMKFGTKTITETVKKKTVEKVVTDYDTITLTPIKVTPNDCFTTEGRVFTLTRDNLQ